MSVYQKMRVKKGKKMQKASQPLVDGLKQVLDATHLLYLKTHEAHWNVTGPMFPQLHELFGSQYADLHDATDELAERLRQVKAPAFFPPFAGDGYPVDVAARVATIQAQHELLSALCSNVSKYAEAEGDQGTIDLLGRRMGAHDKAAWMLRSILEEPKPCCDMAPEPIATETATSWVPMSMSFGEWMWSHGITKSASHEVLADGSQLMALPEIMAKAVTGQPKPGAKYIKRTPTGNAKRPWKYFYAVQHGGGVANKEHFVEGASFKHGDGHFHIHGVKDGKLIVSHGDGEKNQMTHDELASKLTEHHGKAIAEHKEKLLGEIEDARKAGNAKGVERLSAEAKKAGYVTAKKLKSVSEQLDEKRSAKMGDGFYNIADYVTGRPSVKHASEVTANDKPSVMHGTYDEAHKSAVSAQESRIRQAQRLLDGKASTGELKPDDLKKVEARMAEEKAHLAALHAENVPDAVKVERKMRADQEALDRGINEHLAARSKEKPEHPDAWSGGAPRSDAQLAADGYVKGSEGSWSKPAGASVKAAKEEPKKAENKPETPYVIPVKGGEEAAIKHRIGHAKRWLEMTSLSPEARKTGEDELAGHQAQLAAFRANRDGAKPPEVKIPTEKVEHSIPNSTNLERASWTPNKAGDTAGTMRVHFKNGGAYDYKDVPHEHYHATVNAGSPGEAYNDRVKGKYESTKIRAGGTNTGSRAEGPVKTSKTELNEQAATRKEKAAEKQKQAANFVKERDEVRAKAIDPNKDHRMDAKLSDHAKADAEAKRAMYAEEEASMREAKVEEHARAPKPTHADLVNKAKETYNLSDTEADKVHARSLKGGADKHVAEGRHEDAQAAVNQAVKDHLILSKERGMSPSKAKGYMDKHDALAAKKGIKKAFGSSFLEAFKTLSKGG